VSIVEGPRAGRCLQVTQARPQQVQAQVALARTLASEGVQPAVIQSDRGACFIGTETGSAAVPSRLTLWLWSLGMDHRLLPPRRPQRNGAVERLHGALERSWQGEPGGVEALLPVWNQGKQVATPATTPYRGRAGSDLTRVWTGLADVQVQRRVTRQGTISLWDRPVRIGRDWAEQTVTVTFDASRRLLVVHDAYATLVGELDLPWLTLDWLWGSVPVTDQVTHPGVTSSER
jgi:hypothetical protein